MGERAAMRVIRDVAVVMERVGLVGIGGSVRVLGSQQVYHGHIFVVLGAAFVAVCSMMLHTGAKVRIYILITEFDQVFSEFFTSHVG